MLPVKFLGGAHEWAREGGVKTFSRERKQLHVCREGAVNCSLPGDKLWHVDVLAVFPLGAQPPDYVAKPKRREWARWHAQIKGQVPAGRGKGGPVTSVPTFPPSPPDRISALRSRLQQRAPAGAGRGSGSARSHASPARRPARDKPKRRRESRQDGTRGGDQFGLAATGSTTEIPINAGSAGTSRGAARYVGSRRGDPDAEVGDDGTAEVGATAVARARPQARTVWYRLYRRRRPESPDLCSGCCLPT